MADDLTPSEVLVRDANQLLTDVRDGAKTLTGITTIGDVVDHLTNTLWPTIEAAAELLVAHANETEEMAGSIDELIEEAGDLLTPETAGVFANVFIQGREIAAELEKRLTPADSALRAKITAFNILLDAAQSDLAEATADVDEEDPDAAND